MYLAAQISVRVSSRQPRNGMHAYGAFQLTQASPAALIAEQSMNALCQDHLQGKLLAGLQLIDAVCDERVDGDSAPDEG